MSTLNETDATNSFAPRGEEERIEEREREVGRRAERGVTEMEGE